MTDQPPNHEQLRRELESSAQRMRATLARRHRSTRLAVICLPIAGVLGAVVSVILLVTGFDDGHAGPPPRTTPSVAAPQPPTSGPGDLGQLREHTVQRGDTLARIAVRYRVPVERIAADNHLADPDRIITGERLTIQPAAPGVEVIAPGQTLSGCADRHGLTVARLLALNPHITDPDLIRAGSELRVAS